MDVSPTRVAGNKFVGWAARSKAHLSDKPPFALIDGPSLSLWPILPTGAAREIKGIPTGWNHIKEVRDAARGLRSRIKQINDGLANPNLSAARRAELTAELAEARKIWMPLEKPFQVNFLVMTQQNDNKPEQSQALDVQQILGAVKAGIPVSTPLRQLVRQQLANPGPDTDIYSLIHILGRLNDQESRPLLEKYLDYGLNEKQAYDDPEMVRRISIQVLCGWWVSPDHFQYAVQAAFHDPSDFVRMMAAIAHDFRTAAGAGIMVPVGGPKHGRSSESKASDV